MKTILFSRLGFACLSAVLISLGFGPHGVGAEGLLETGVARADITPDYAVRLSGFGFRREESEGVTQRIFAKALAFADAKEGPAILIAADNLCVPDEITRIIARRLGPKVGLKLERLTITATHTHTAPMLKDVCPTLFGVSIPAEHQANIDRYTKEFVDKLEEVALAAVRDIQPARVSWGIGKATFAANRRTKGGPVDHDLPVMAVRSVGGKLRAVYFSYACHCVTLSNNKVSGDWAGFAQSAIEENHPGVIAVASVGCGADSNPNPRGAGDDVNLCQAQGKQVADEVKRLLGGELKAITVPPVTKYVRVQVPFDQHPTRAEWEEKAKLQDAVGHHARVTLGKLERGEKLPEAMDYPVQSWIFGEELAMVFLPGETVVDYALRIKKEYDKARLWVNGYANEGRCYLPSERILREGGYEGGGAMIYYDFPTRFAPGVEEIVMGAVAGQLPAGFKAASGTEGIRPLSATEALKTFRTRANLEVELVAAEPLVQDPIAIDWGPDGRLWVCEMNDYPSGTDNNWQPGGRVKWLRDRDGDGSYDEAVLFAEGLAFPTGLMCWNGGVLICAAPDILFARDENGDGRADKIEKIFSGFATDNFQARVNSLTLGLDNWIYAANGLLGGMIRAEKNSLLPERGAAALDIRGRDIRFSPFTGVIETVSGLTQQGRTRDDFGNWFGCDNTRLLLHFPRPEHYMRRNPHIPSPDAIRLTTTGREANRLFPASPLQERFNDPDNANRVTSACGVGIYRDTLLGEKFFGNAFTCDPVHNLVHREVLSGDVLVSSRRAEDESDSEFLSSTDNWFRPTQVRTGPDGALYVVDMYRFLIEHPRWIPAERLAQIDIRAGADRGRIYRVKRKGVALRAVRDLTAISAEELAAVLDSANGTERDRVQLALLTHKSKAGAGGVLAKITREAKLPQVRVQALSALDGVGKLEREQVKSALRDRDARVREFALHLAEKVLGDRPERELLNAMFALRSDADVRVRRQLAFALGEVRDAEAGRVLAEIATKDLNNAEIRAAVLSSALPHVAEIFEAVMRNPDQVAARPWIEPLVATAAGVGDEKILSRAMQGALTEVEADLSQTKLSTLASLLTTVGRNAELRRKIASEKSDETRRLHALMPRVRAVAVNGNVEISTRVTAVKIVAFGGQEEDRSSILGLATDASPEVRRAALGALREQASEGESEELIERLPELSPTVRAEVLTFLLERPGSSMELLEAIRGGQVEARSIGLAERQRLSGHENVAIRKLAGEVIPKVETSARGEVIAKNSEALKLTGNAANGEKIFAEQCASCHRLKTMGHEVGPDLATLRNKDAEYWLKNILDPNAVIEPRFISYNVELTGDRSISGIIKNESATSLTIAGGNGVTETVQRSNIRQIRASPLSLMPEGLEQTANAQQFADLIAFLRAGDSPKVPSSSDVLRDAPSVARFILDSSRSDAARETAVKSNPQFAAALIAEMTRDLQPGTPEEYVRIPWIWRVAIACGRRNDAAQLRKMLANSLPKMDEPLRDWQVVVIGGGIINGISERGLVPAERIADFMSSDKDLRLRWERALELASKMADDAKVPNGTRYDALRMIGMVSWENRGAQLLKYLSKETNSELQMGAVSGLADLHSKEADLALRNALPQLTESNRKLAEAALSKRAGASKQSNN